MHEGVRAQPNLAGTGGPQNAVRVLHTTVVEDAINQNDPTLLPLVLVLAV